MIYLDVKTHRDASIKNTQIIEDDVNGAFYAVQKARYPLSFQ